MTVSTGVGDDIPTFHTICMETSKYMTDFLVLGSILVIGCP